MIRISLLVLLFLFGVEIGLPQTVDVKATTDPKKINTLLRKIDDETKANKAYYAEEKKCRTLISQGDFAEAERSCRQAILLVEKLPTDQALAKSSSRVALAVVMLCQQKSAEAIALLNTSLELGKPIIDDTDAETGERYFLLGQAYHQLANIDEAKRFYLKAENTYRTAFKEMGDSDIRAFYPRPIINILASHLLLLRNAGLTDDAARIEKRLAETKIQFAEFLKN